VEEGGTRRKRKSSDNFLHGRRKVLIISLLKMLEVIPPRQVRLEEYESVKRWITRLNKRSGSPNTRRMYLYWLERFCRYSERSPDELIAERREDLRSGDDYVRHRTEDRLDAWFSELEGSGLSRNSCVQAYNAVRSFYKANRMELEMDETPSSWPSRIKPGLTREELGRLIEACRKHMRRAYVLCQAQSGLGVGDLLRITYGDVESQLKKDMDHIHLRLLRGKEKRLGQFDTFFGRMATQALKEYLKTRGDLNPQSRLFPITARAVNKFLRILSFRAGLDWIVSSHSLRKYFNTQMKMAGLNETLVEYWMGHSLGKTRGAYFLPPVEEQLRLYKQAEKWLEPV
jgi:site-specific recombinase XerD